ncbi:hypothetical protein [Arthrobacter cryoconiti]|uniref:Uncharacterized protein n=1 Tax=Arthrobacter cryoconiti TaxID=748907 RepID=A0ABV8R042_9MICC|nr:hypothetical protein [Arthrobacter cryoconiti]MCC9068480.1 hypothetical protein [Arthrobacter cryoconiti]
MPVQSPTGQASGYFIEADDSDNSSNLLLADAPPAPSGNDYDIYTDAGKAAFNKAVDQWKAQLTPAQRAQLEEAANAEVEPGDDAEFDWFESLAPELRRTCVQMPIIGVSLVALHLPGTGTSGSELPTTVAKSIKDISDLQTDTDLKALLNSLSSAIARHAHEMPPIDDPVITQGESELTDWISAHCTMDGH